MIIDKDYIEKNFLGTSSPSQKSAKDSRKESLDALSTQTKNSRLVPRAWRESDEGKVEEFNEDPEAAFRKIERLLSVRDRSVAETVQRLQRDRFTPRAINDAVERALRCGYLDDDRFADGFIRSRLRAAKGIKGIERDLKDHGIDVSQIPGFPDTFLEESGSQLENAVRLLVRKPPRAKNQRQAAYAKLIRNGFSSNIASSAVKQWIAQNE